MLEQIFDNLTRALSLEIDAIRQRGGESVVEVHEGERAGGAAAGGPGDRLYRFSMPEDQMLREDIPIKMVVAGEEVDGAVVSVEEGGVIVSIEKDLGDTIPFARIVSDNSFLAERLRDRLRKVAGGGEQFNAVKALQAIGQAEIRGAPDEKASVDSGSMNAEQELAVRTALGCETAIIWGPPGTGKTTTLAAVIEALYRRRQRILVVSNTNLAVDTLIEKVGDRLRGGEEFEKRNAVLRYGAMVKPELLEKYQRQMDLFGAVNRIGNEFARARSSAKARLEKIRVASTRLKRMVRGEEKATVPNPAAALEEISNRAQQIQIEMKEAEQRQANLKDQVLEASRIVATTAHQVYLKPKDFRDFDVVVIDEASMLQLAIVFYVAGLAKKRLVITGDFRQLPPIVASDREEVKEWLGKTVFEHAGILKAVNKGLNPVHMVPLRTQYRMAPEICALINDTFYRGILRTGPGAGHTKRSSDLLGKRIAIVDTSFRGPAVGVKQGTFSRYNLLHATVVRNLVYHLLREGYAGQNDVMDAIGVITPYAAQSQLINRAIEELGTIEAPIASTVHRYQGNEKDLIVIDITDGWGARPSRFVAADSIDEDGAKLMNVALSRARSQLVIVANLKYLDTRLKEEAILRTVLGQARKEGQVIAADDLLRLGPDVEGDWKANMRVNKAAFDWTKAHLYNKTNVSGPLEKDIEGAKKSIVIFSSKTTAEGVARWRPLLGRKVAEGVTVRVVTQPPASQGEANAGSAVDELLSAGAIVDLRQDVGEKIVLIDGSVIWHGSLDPLAHDGRLNDSLIRYASKALSAVMSGFMSIARLKGQGYVPAGEAMTVRENDPCESCGALSVLRHGPQGHYFECSRKCGWQLDIRKAGGAAMTDSERAALFGADVSELLGGEPVDGSDSDQSDPNGTETRNCKECGSEMKLKNGRYGPFWGCSAYPKCRHIEKAA